MLPAPIFITAVKLLARYLRRRDWRAAAAVIAGPQSKRAQKCKDAKHCRHFVRERDGEVSWGCAWDDCKTYAILYHLGPLCKAGRVIRYNHQLTAKEQCTEMTDHCEWSGTKCVQKQEA